MASLFDTDDFNARLFYPRREPTPAVAGALDREIAGEASLHVRWHRADAALPTLLLFHGNGETVGDYDGSAAAFAAAGVNLAVMDYRGYGRSAGVPTLRNALADAIRVLDEVRAWTGAPLVVMGRSLGSACAAELYRREPTGVAGFVIESGSSDLRALVGRRGLTPPEAFDAADSATFDPLPKLGAGRAPLLVLHGELDTLIAPSEARATFAAAGTTSKQLVLIADRGHNDLSHAKAYWDALAAFVVFVRQLA